MIGFKLLTVGIVILAQTQGAVMPRTGNATQAGPVINLHTTRVGKTSFAARWSASYAPEGYAYIVRDLNTHTQIGPLRHTRLLSVSIYGLRPGDSYNFGIQGLPGGPGANIHITTKSSGITNKALGNRSIPSIRGTGYKAFAMALMLRHGWGLGQQWTDFQDIEMHEAGWNPYARNPVTGAFGIAQALGHGNANTAAASGENNYGGFNTSDAICRAANGGNGYAQLIWMMNYIQIVYGSPARAWGQYYSSGQGSY